VTQGGQQPEATPQATDIDEAAHPAREMSLHLLRMLETRMEAAGLVLQAEGQRLAGRLQLHILAAAAVFIAIWGGIVLLAIALPEKLRLPVLAAVIAAFVLVAVWAVLRARRMIAGREAGSVAWLLDSLKLDLEVLARALAPPPAAAQPPPGEPPRSSGDLAA
jgi:uncharacterized membrane protein YqjE